MRDDDLANDRQAEPCAAGMLRGRNAIELLENARHVLGGDSLAGVADREPGPLAFGECAEADRSPLRGVLDRVHDQVVEDVLDPLAIDHHGHFFSVKFRGESETTGLSLRLKPSDCLNNELFRGHRRQAPRGLPGLNL